MAAEFLLRISSVLLRGQRAPGHSPSTERRVTFANHQMILCLRPSGYFECEPFFSPLIDRPVDTKDQPAHIIRRRGNVSDGETEVRRGTSIIGGHSDQITTRGGQACLCRPAKTSTQARRTVGQPPGRISSSSNCRSSRSVCRLFGFPSDGISVQAWIFWAI